MCIETRHAKAAITAMSRNKNDRNDARSLAQIVRSGGFKAVHVKSTDSQELRTLLTSREFLEKTELQFLVEATTPGFVAPLFSLPGSSLLATIQSRLAHKLAPMLGLVLHEPPITIPILQEIMSRHSVYDADPAHLWLRQFLLRVAEHMD